MHILGPRLAGQGGDRAAGSLWRGSAASMPSGPALGLADFPHLLHCPCNSEGQPDSTCVHLKSSGRERGRRTAMLAAVVVPLCNVAAVTFELERRHNPASTLAVLKGQGHIGSFFTKLLAGFNLSCM